MLSLVVVHSWSMDWEMRGVRDQDTTPILCGYRALFIHGSRLRTI
jgi:hypothetical protein